MADRPSWVIKDLAEVLGLDRDSVAQLVLPDLEGYNNETRLKSHLQDFLGPSPAAKTFIDKYTALRFPRLPTIPAAPSNPGPSKLGKGQPLFSKPSLFPGQVRTPSQHSTPPNQPHPQPSTAQLQDALENAFGPGGKVYQKNRDADVSAPTSTGLPRFEGGISQVGGGSAEGSGSGSHTPARRAGALSVNEVQHRSRAGVSEGGSGAGSERSSQKGKSRRDVGNKIWDHPKSKATLKLEALMADLVILQDGGKVGRNDEQPDCFCQARLHPLSNYTPLCTSCGLIICILHPTTSPCPSCAHPLLSPAALRRTILSVQSDIDAQLAKEQQAREAVERKRLAAVQAEAAFPSLASSGHGASGMGMGVGMAGMIGRKEEVQGRKVLTIGAAGPGKGKGKAKSRVTLTTTIPAPAPHLMQDENEEEEIRYPSDIVPRPRSPPLEASRVEKELTKHLNWRKEEDRPWGDMKAVKKGASWEYVELAIGYGAGDNLGGGTRRTKKKGQGVDGRNVPGAKPIPA